ncbi:hypothetical protein [Actinocorallia lasiicapitis]
MGGFGFVAPKFADRLDDCHGHADDHDYGARDLVLSFFPQAPSSQAGECRHDRRNGKGCGDESAAPFPAMAFGGFIANRFVLL